VLFVGEAPGASEDALGEPFVGPAGQLLDNESAKNPGIVQCALPAWVRRAFTNLVCCFPREAKDRGDNEPQDEEIMACRPRLHEFISKVAQPKLIVCVGQLASNYIGQHDAYGKVLGAKVIEIVHPAFILRSMPLVQKQMAVQKSIIQIRSAASEVLQCQYPR
jgi:DNA polymerase